MKVEFTAIVIRDNKTNEILAVYPIKDYDDNVQVVFQPEWIESVEDIKAALKQWGKDTRKYAAGNWIEGESFTLEDDAKHIPSIGNALVRVETKMIDWE
jgi:hypothetical protein